MSHYDELARVALEARKNAYAPYSHYHVGAAVMSDSGAIYRGVNVENASYGATVCAERVAIFTMVAEEGPQVRIKALAIATESDPPAPPCGMCLQVITEFADGDVPILLVSPSGSIHESTLDDLLPHRFTPDHLDS